VNKNRSSTGRLARHFSAACCLLMSSPALSANPSKDLVGAFKATYQQEPPLIRTIKEPIFEYEHPDHVVEVLTPTVILAPARLVKLHKARYALIVSETAQKVGHASLGAFSVSYLNHDKGWRLEQVWPELTFMGTFGIPADEIWEASFWSEPLVLASSTYCGMGGCEAGIAAFSLGETAPRFLGIIPGTSEYGLVEPGVGDCETYHYTARISAPSSKKNVLSVSYFGWTAPPGSIKPKHWFRRKTDYALSGHTLIATPEIKIPDCGK
jgi:hypothetical protein